MSEKPVQVDIGAALAALQASPELCEAMIELVGGPALIEAQAEIERLQAQAALAEKAIGIYRKTIAVQAEIRCASTALYRAAHWMTPSLSHPDQDKLWKDLRDALDLAPGGSHKPATLPPTGSRPPLKPHRGRIEWWSKRPCEGGLGYRILGHFREHPNFSPYIWAWSSFVVKHDEASGEIETANSRYTLVGAEELKVAA